MDINNLLKGMACPCGRHHACDIAYVSVAPNAIGSLSEITKFYATILLVADENTYGAAGAATEAALSGKNIRKVIFTGKTVLILLKL